MNINFELYKVFYEVANAKSITKGAQNLNISQPAVTQSIKTLEDELNGKLFTRTQKGVELTHEGKELYKYIKEGMTYFINGKNKFDALKSLETGVLNIGSSTSIAENYLIKYLTIFNKHYPNVQINITNDLTDNLIKDLRNGSLDIVIMSYNNQPLKDLTIKELTNLHDIFVSSKPTNKTLEEILNEGLLLQKHPSVTRVNFNKFIEQNNLTYKTKMEVVSHSLLTNLTKNNFGISVLTKEYILNDLNKTLFEIKTDIKIPPRKLVYAIKQDTYPTFSSQKFIDILKEVD